MKKLLINWVYYLPAGHLVEAIRNAYEYYVVNKDRVEISVLANAQTPVELARGCPWISQVYEVSLAEVCEKREQASCLQAIPKEWDYILTDPRVKPEAFDDDEQAIRIHCARQLPDMSIPVRFVRVEAIPRNEFGKIDRQRLQSFARMPS